jgi:dipeptidyl aminopeptidase/acylaminoacyl peptidase
MNRIDAFVSSIRRGKARCGRAHTTRTAMVRTAILVVSVATNVCLGLTDTTKHSVSLADLQGLHYVGAVAIAPDGKQVAYNIGEEIYLVRVDSPTSPIRVATGVSPSWSPDSRRLAYYAEQHGSMRLWFRDVGHRRTTIADKLTARLDTTTAPAWSPDGTKLLVMVIAQPQQISIPQVPESVPLVISSESPPWLASSGLFRGSDLIRERAAPLRKQVIVVSASGETLWDVSRDAENASEPAWSPDGKMVAFLVFDANHDATQLAQVNVRSGVRSTLAAGNRMSSMCWSPDGRNIAFLDSIGRYGSLTGAFVVATTAGPPFSPRNLSEHLDREISDLAWAGDGQSLIVLIRDGVNQPIGLLSLQGQFDPVTWGDAQRKHLSVTPTGTLSWAESDAEHLDRIWIRHANSAEAKLVANPNPQIDDWQLGKQQVVRWKNSRGELLEGVLVLPPGHVLGKRVALIVDPYSHRLNSFMGIPLLANRYLAAQGYALFFPNHRGFFTFPKSLKGDAYARVSHNDNAEVMADDILSGVDELVRAGIADPQRLSLYGFSTGACAVDLLLTKTERFQAAISSAGVADWVHYYFQVPTNDDTIPNMLDGRTPWDAPDLYRKLSAVYQADRIRTSLLLVVGDKDQRLLDSVFFYDALRRLNRSVTLARYPDQGHEFGDNALQNYWDMCLKFLKEHGN